MSELAPESAPESSLAGAAPAAGEWWLPGYRIGRVLGRGGFAVVYEAEQVSLRRRVAVKLLTTDLCDEGDRRRFERECEALTRLSPHPHVVDVIDAGVTPERRPYIVMRLYPGGSLADQVAEHGPMAAGEVVAIATKLASGLDAAHASGLLHRDVKPQNVLLTESGEPVLADFGIAGVMDDGRDVHHTSTAFFSPAHVAPEILEHRHFSVASDVYALASTCYQLLTGRPAFDPNDPRVGAQILDADPAPIRQPGVPPGLAAVVVAAMAKDPSRRPAGAGRFAADLAAALAATADDAVTELLTSAPTTASPVGGTVAPERDRRRKWRVVAGLLLAVVVAGLLAWQTLIGDGSGKPGPTVVASSGGGAPEVVAAGSPPVPSSTTIAPTTSAAPAATTPSRSPKGADEPAAAPARSTPSTGTPASSPTQSTVRPPSPGRIVITPTTVDFGTGPGNQVTTRTVTITNSGGAALTFQFGISGAGYSVEPQFPTQRPGSSATIDAGTSVVLQVSFARSGFAEPGTYDGTVTVETDSQHLSVPLTGAWQLG